MLQILYLTSAISTKILSLVTHNPSWNPYWSAILSWTWLVNNRRVSDTTAATKPFYDQFKWVFCAAINGIRTPTEPLVNKNVLKCVPHQCNLHRVKMLWDVKYSSPFTHFSQFQKSCPTQLLHNHQLSGAGYLYLFELISKVRDSKVVRDSAFNQIDFV